MTLSDEIIEKVARAIDPSAWIAETRNCGWKWSPGEPAKSQEKARSLARAACTTLLTSLREEGLVVVKKVPPTHVRRAVAARINNALAVHGVDGGGSWNFGDDIIETYISASQTQGEHNG